MKKHFNKELVMTKKDDDDFENSTKRSIWDNVYVDGDVKVRDHSHITRQYRGSAHRDCSIKVKLNHKIYVVLLDLKKYDSHFIMQELDKVDCKIDVILNELEKIYEL